MVCLSTRRTFDVQFMGDKVIMSIYINLLLCLSSGIAWVFLYFHHLSILVLVPTYPVYQEVLDRYLIVQKVPRKQYAMLEQNITKLVSFWLGLSKYSIYGYRFNKTSASYLGLNNNNIFLFKDIKTFKTITV